MSPFTIHQPVSWNVSSNQLSTVPLCMHTPAQSRNRIQNHTRWL